MNDKPENPAAFPEHKFESYGGGAGQHVMTGGMTLRDYFAGQALASITSGTPNFRAVYSYEIADEMLKERNND